MPALALIWDEFLLFASVRGLHLLAVGYPAAISENDPRGIICGSALLSVISRSGDFSSRKPFVFGVPGKEDDGFIRNLCKEREDRADLFAFQRVKYFINRIKAGKVLQRLERGRTEDYFTNVIFCKRISWGDPESLQSSLFDHGLLPARQGGVQQRNKCRNAGAVPPG